MFALAISKRSIQHFVNVGKVSSSVTRWGEFWKVCATNFLTKVGQIFSNWYRLLFEKHHLWVKRLIFIFGQLLWKSGLLFSSTSGHTAGNPTSNLIKWFLWFYRWVSERVDSSGFESIKYHHHEWWKQKIKFVFPFFVLLRKNRKNSFSCGSS